MIVIIVFAIHSTVNTFSHIFVYGSNKILSCNYIIDLRDDHRILVLMSSNVKTNCLTTCTMGVNIAYLYLHNIIIHKYGIIFCYSIYQIGTNMADFDNPAFTGDEDTKKKQPIRQDEPQPQLDIDAPTYQCGYGSFYPNYLQNCNTPYGALFWITLFSFTEGM